MKNLNYQVLRFGLQKLHEELESVKAEWDGDLPGALEDRAMMAADAQTKVAELQDLLDELYPQ